LVTVANIARCLKYRRVSDLVCQNSDYLLNSISLNLRYVDMNPNAPTVLRSMLRCCDARIMDFLQDTVEEVFEALDGYQEDRTHIFVRILLSLVSSFRQWDEQRTAREHVRQLRHCFGPFRT